jgi:hypothetical protein
VCNDNSSFGIIKIFPFWKLHCRKKTERDGCRVFKWVFVRVENAEAPNLLEDIDGGIKCFLLFRVFVVFPNRQHHVHPNAKEALSILCIPCVIKPSVHYVGKKNIRIIKMRRERRR